MTCIMHLPVDIASAARVSLPDIFFLKTVIALLQLLCYVFTLFGSREESAVKADIDRYISVRRGKALR